MNVAIVKYNAGNVHSVENALRRIGVEPVLTDNPNELQSADKVIFPGVGEASYAMKMLKESGLDTLIPTLKQPVFGICLGMQLMCKYSEEGNTNCLGIFDNQIKLFKGEVKVPQIGWNNIYELKTNIYKGIKENEYMYFVHSYYAELSEYTIAKTSYGIEYSSSLQKNNFYAAQFHPEKSSDAGQQLLENFIKL